jgi:hypothetical protein
MPGMNGDDLTKSQIQQLQAVVARYHRFLMRLTDRMNRRGFIPTDSLMAKAMDAQNAIHALGVELHYLGCDHGVGRPPRNKQPHWSEAMGRDETPRGDIATGKIDPQKGRGGG